MDIKMHFDKKNKDTRILIDGQEIKSVSKVNIDCNAGEIYPVVTLTFYPETLDCQGDLEVLKVIKDKGTEKEYVVSFN